jgi:hypothetical protein
MVAVVGQEKTSWPFRHRRWGELGRARRYVRRRLVTITGVRGLLMTRTWSQATMESSRYGVPVVRRSFRMGLWLGLLAGVLLAVVKMAQTRREDQQWDATPAEWPPLENEPQETEPQESAPAVDFLPPPGPPAAEAPPLEDGELPAPPTDDELVDAFLEGPGPEPETFEPEVLEPVLEAPDPTVEVPELVMDPPEAVTELLEPVVVEPSEPATEVLEPVADADEPAVQIMETVEPPPPAPVPRKAAATKKVRKATVKKAAKKAATVTGKKASPAKASAAKTSKVTVAKTSKKASAITTKKARATAAPAVGWVEAEDGACPQSHPVKAKLASRLFHLPGMAFYGRTRADRCYADEESAVSDGFTRSKR